MKHIMSLLLSCSLNSPHHMGHRHMGPSNMGQHYNNNESNAIDDYDYNVILNYTIEQNSTLNETDTENTDTSETDFSLPMGIGASLGIISFILLAYENLRKKNVEDDREIYIEPIEDNERDSIITNPNYESHIYEVVDPVYELSDNIESKL